MEEMEKRVRGLEAAVRIFAAGVALVVGGLAVSALMSNPRYQKIFEEMLGTSDKLPALTQFIMNNNGVITLASAFATVAAIVFAVRLPGRGALVGFGGTLAALVVVWLAVRSAATQPFLRIIQEMTGG